MSRARAKLTVRLPVDHLEFLKEYAARHGLTATEVIDRYLERLRAGADEQPLHPEVLRISGLVPSEVDAEGEVREHLARKHR